MATFRRCPPEEVATWQRVGGGPGRGHFKDLTGSRFGKLLVLGKVGNIKGKLFWRVRCDCGTEKQVAGYKLTRKGRPSRSCGCVSRLGWHSRLPKP